MTEGNIYYLRINNSSVHPKLIVIFRNSKITGNYPGTTINIINNSLNNFFTAASSTKLTSSWNHGIEQLKILKSENMVPSQFHTTVLDKSTQ